MIRYRNALIFIALMGFLGLNSHGQEKQVPLAYVDQCTFHRPNGKPFTEIYVQIPAILLKFKPENQKGLKGKAKITVKVLNQSDVFHENTYTLKSPLLKDTSKLNFYLNDQISIPLKHDETFHVKIKIKDAYNTDNTIHYENKIDTHIPANKVSFSDIKLIDTAYRSKTKNRFSQNNYTMIPNANGLVNKQDKRFYVYNEIYQTQRILHSDSFYFKIALIKDKDTLLKKARKMSTRGVVPALSKFSTSPLKNGVHHIHFEARNSKKQLIASTKKKIITRQETDEAFLSDTIRGYTKDSLKTFLKWHSPIVNKKEMAFLKKYTEQKTPKDSLVRFIVKFWNDHHPRRPNEAWRIYKKRAHLVDRKYTNSINEGYQTDRGRVYLQYGPPNSVVRSQDDPNTHSYEIWHYNRTEKQANVKFVFYSTSILDEEFIILHSNALGEYKNPDWRKQLNRNPFKKKNSWGNDPKWDYQK